MRLRLQVLVCALTACLARSLDVTFTKFDSPILDIKWAGENDSVVFVLTTLGRLWRSVDGGKNFFDESESAGTDFGKAPAAEPKFNQISVNPSNPNFIFLRSDNFHHLISGDGGAPESVGEAVNGDGIGSSGGVGSAESDSGVEVTIDGERRNGLVTPFVNTASGSSCPSHQQE